MAIINIERANLSFGKDLLLDNISLGIEKYEKIGLIGRNGTGKSSFLKAIAGKIALDSGNIYLTNNTRVVYIEQESTFLDSNTVLQELFLSYESIYNNLFKYEALLKQLETIDVVNDTGLSEKLLLELSELQAQIEYGDGITNGFNLKYKIDKVLSDLKLDATSLISTLSGGQKKKLAFAKAMLLEPDVLLLDEPTNHQIGRAHV